MILADWPFPALRERYYLIACGLIGERRIRTRVAARFPLARVGEAHELLESSPDLVGRIVVLPWA